jgi:nicotinate-nucleotide adenylyltransferase
MNRLGFFGGTFDPVHYGHLKAVEGARRELDLPKILLLPNPQPPHKLKEPLTPYRHRKEMLRLALAEFPELEIAEFEEDAIGPAYTTDTMRRVLSSLPSEIEHELWLIVGMDSLIELPRWKNPEELFNLARIAALPRPGFDITRVQQNHLSRVKILSTPLLDVSATEIRRRIRSGESIVGLVAPSVADYIRDWKLYL